MKTELFTRDQVIKLIEKSMSENVIDHSEIKSKLKVDSDKFKILLLDKDIIEINIKNVSIDIEPTIRFLIIDTDGSFRTKYVKGKDANKITDYYHNGLNINSNILSEVRYYDMSLYHRINIVKIGRSIVVDYVMRNEKNKVDDKDLNYIKFKHRHDDENCVEISTIGYGHLRDVYESICKYSDTTSIIEYGET